MECFQSPGKEKMYENRMNAHRAVTATATEGILRVGSGFMTDDEEA